MSELSNLTLDVRPGEQLRLDDGRIVLEVLEKSGRAARVRVTAPRDVTIQRSGGDETAEEKAG